MTHLLFPIKDFQLEMSDESFFRKEKIPPGDYDDEIDQRIQIFLNSHKDKEIKSLTLPVSLTDNFMEFSGLIFAYHVRLTREFSSCDAPIIFYGTLELEQLLRLTPLARILITTNVLYVNLTKYNFEQIKESIIRYKPMSFKFEDFINQIEIKPPANYDSHHSIDNESALIQWSRYIGCYDNLPYLFKKEFDNRLYFKYLRALNPISEIIQKNGDLKEKETKDNIKGLSKAKVLLIDDEAEKGWKTFYEEFLKYSQTISFTTLNIDFKKLNKKEIIGEAEIKIKNFNPDVVLLDLRLHDSDFEWETTPEKLTGIQIIEKIKEINKGIQVIVTTASNKAWNFNLAKQKGAYDFIIKDGSDSPRKAIRRLKEVFEICVRRAILLKRLNHNIEEVIQTINKNHHFDENSIDSEFEKKEARNKVRANFIKNLDIAYELFDLGCEVPSEDKYHAYSYLQFFICIEDFANVKHENLINPILFKQNDQLFLKNNKLDICIAQKMQNQWQSKIFFKSGKYILSKEINKIRMDTNFYVSAILIFKYGNENSSIKKWTDIYSTRNRVAHEGGIIPTNEQIQKLLDFIKYFLDNSNENVNNINKGMTPKTLEESIQELQRKYNNN